MLLAGAWAAGGAALSACAPAPGSPRPGVGAANGPGEAGARVDPGASAPSDRMSEGDRFERSLRLLAPSNYMSRLNNVELGLKRLRAAGFLPENESALYRSDLRFAGTDRQRADDFNDLLRRKAPFPKTLLAARGGYGSMRILPMVDWGRLGGMIKERGSLLMGFSDFTAPQLAVFARAKAPYFQGPMFQSEFANPAVSDFTVNSFARVMSSDSVKESVLDARAPRNADLSGVVWGGNLSVLSAMAGSPWMPDVDGGILFLEDVAEPAYRIERMLMTLYLAGVLKKQRAVLLGAVLEARSSDSYARGYNLGAVFDYVSSVSGVPFFRNFPFGHVRQKFCVPLGVPCRIVSEANGYSATFSGYPRLKSELFEFGALRSGWSFPKPEERAPNAPGSGAVDSQPVDLRSAEPGPGGEAPSFEAPSAEAPREGAGSAAEPEPAPETGPERRPKMGQSAERFGESAANPGDEIARDRRENGDSALARGAESPDSAAPIDSAESESRAPEEISGAAGFAPMRRNRGDGFARPGEPLAGKAPNGGWNAEDGGPVD